MENTNNAAVEITKLTPAELEMIAVKRQQDELKKKEDEVRKQVQHEKNIVIEKEKIAKFISSMETQRVATHNFLSQLKALKMEESIPRYSLLEEDKEQKFELYDYEGNEKKVYFTESVPFILTKIAVKEGYSIKVEEYFTSSSSWSTRRESHGHRMFLCGAGWEVERKALKNPKTMNDKIQSLVDSQIYRKEQQQQKSTAREQALELLTAKYPNTIITHDYSISSHNRGRDHSTTEFYKVTFENGLCVKFTYSLDMAIKENEETKVKVSLYGFEGISSLKLDNVIEALKNIEKQA